jgi:hypothetical protein
VCPSGSVIRENPSYLCNRGPNTKSPKGVGITILTPHAIRPMQGDKAQRGSYPKRVGGVTEGNVRRRKSIP